MKLHPDVFKLSDKEIKRRYHSMKLYERRIWRIWGYLVDTSETLFKSMRDYCTIRCAKCGEYFDIRPDNHTHSIGNPRGCGICKSVFNGRRTYKGKTTFLYAIEITLNNVTYGKVGLTQVSVEKRFKYLLDIGAEIKVLGLWEFNKNGEIAHDLEQSVLIETRNFKPDENVAKAFMGNAGGWTEIRDLPGVYLVDCVEDARKNLNIRYEN